MACGPRRVGVEVGEAIFRHLKRWDKKKRGIIRCAHHTGFKNFMINSANSNNVSYFAFIFSDK